MYDYNNVFNCYTDLNLFLKKNDYSYEILIVIKEVYIYFLLYLYILD